ncbi:MAG: VWA domain-containing protein [Pseudomonadota bacterium]
MNPLLSIQWHWPWAFALLLLPLALWLAGLLRRARLLDYADPALRPWAIADQAKAGQGRPWLHAPAWLLLAAALAGPRLPVEQPGEATPSRHDVQLLALLDLSESMQASDIDPSRLERAILKLSALPEHLAGESLGLAVFAGTAGVVMPPSRDAGVFRFGLEQGLGILDDAPGTELATALDLALNAQLAQARSLREEDERHGRAILLVTDGEAEALQGNALLAAVERLRETNTPLFILGTGTTEGAPIPDGAGGFRMLDGEIWQSRMDATRLAEMAERTGGRFIPVADGDGDLRALAKSIAELPSHPDPGAARAWRELFLVPLLGGLVLLMLAYAPPLRSSWPYTPRPSMASAPLTRGEVRGARGAGSLAILPALLLGGMLTSPDDALAQSDPAEAYAAWARGDFVQAQLLYARLPGAQARLGEGAAAYRRGDFAHATQNFTTAWLLAGDDATRADALYNLGNAELKAGHPERATAAYEAVLRLRPGDEAAEANLWLARQQAEDRSMQRSRPESPPGRRPTDYGRYDEDVTADFPTEEAASGGDLSAGGPGGGKPAGKVAGALALTEADRQAAEKKMELLRDAPAPLWRAMMRGETPGRVSEGLPW